MSAYAEICSMFEQRRKVEEEYASAAYSQLLTFVELFEFYIGCQQPDLVVPLRIDECCNPLWNVSWKSAMELTASSSST